MSKFITGLCIAGSLVLGLTAPADAQHSNHLTAFNSKVFEIRPDALRMPMARFYHPHVYQHVGMVVPILPTGYYSFIWNTCPYYYSQGLFYQYYADGSYKIAVPPVGAEVPSLPLDAEIITIDGNPYFQYKGIYYESILRPDGEFAYKVVGKDGIMNTNAETDPSLPLVGDLIDQLPTSAHPVKLSGKTYWVTPDEIYLEEFKKDAKNSYRVVWVPERKKHEPAPGITNKG